MPLAFSGSCGLQGSCRGRGMAPSHHKTHPLCLEGPGGAPPSGFRNLWAPRLPRSEEERFPRRVVLETGQSVVPFAPVGCHSWSPSPLPTRGQDNICHLHNVCAFAVWHSLLLQINAFTIKPKCQKKRQPTLRSRLPPSKGV